jgi:autotransporter passenger strand-loop-strand repeat protein
MITVSSGQTYTVSSGQTDTGDVILGGGTLVVVSGGVIANTINSGGTDVISSGGLATDTIVTFGVINAFGALGASSWSSVVARPSGRRSAPALRSSLAVEQPSARRSWTLAPYMSRAAWPSVRRSATARQPPAQEDRWRRRTGQRHDAQRQGRAGYRAVC